MVVPFVLEDFPGEFIDGHSAQCVEAKISLKRFSGEMLKREERAADSAKLKAAALKKALKKKEAETSVVKEKLEAVEQANNLNNNNVEISKNPARETQFSDPPADKKAVRRIFL